MRAERRSLPGSYRRRGSWQVWASIAAVEEQVNQETDIMLDRLQQIVDAVLSALGLRYQARVSADGQRFTFDLYDPRTNRDREQITVRRRENENLESIKGELFSEVQKYLQLCPLCGSEAEHHRHENRDSFWVDCPKCRNRYLISSQQARDIRRARAKGLESTLRKAEAISRMVVASTQPIEITTNSSM